MCLLRSPVATEPKRIELHLDSDPRFAAAAGGIVRYLSESIGMPEEVGREFQQTTVRACSEAFAAGGSREHIIEFLIYHDRLEVTLDPDTGSAATRLSRSVVPQG